MSALPEWAAKYEKRIHELEAERDRLASIHHVKCSLVQSADVCDCALNAGRVWVAKAYNGAAARAEEAESLLNETTKKLRALEAELAKSNSILHLDGLSLRQTIARAEKAESLNEHSRNQIYFLIDQKHKVEARVAELEAARDNWRTRYETLRAHRRR